MKNQHTLAANSIGIIESVVMGTAGAAPAFSISAVTATLIASVNTLAPASILYCGLIMFGITLAFIHLNKVHVNAGASYSWVSQIFGKHLGFFVGWALLVSSALFMVSGSIPSATATLLLIAPESVNNPHWVTFVAAVWVTFISAVTLKGIKPTSYLQFILTGVEIVILLAIIVSAIFQYYEQPTHSFSLSWLSLSHFTPSEFAAGALSSIFLYWGWDVTLNLNEETKNTTTGPGWGAFGSVLVIILLFVSFITVTLIVLNDDEIQQAGTNVIFAIADKLFPKPWSYLAVLSILLSAIGTIETTIVQFTRTLFAQGRDGIVNPRYAKLHPTWYTPWFAIFFIWGFGIIFLFLSSFFPSVNLIIKDSINSISLQVAFYYSLTGFACTWYYRFLWRNIAELLSYVIWPLFSSIFLVFIALFSIPTFDLITNLIGIGGLLIGVVPFIWNVRTTWKIKPNSGGY